MWVFVKLVNFYVGVDLTPYPVVKAYFYVIAAHPAMVAVSFHEYTVSKL